MTSCTLIGHDDGSVLKITHTRALQTRGTVLFLLTLMSSENRKHLDCGNSRRAEKLSTLAIESVQILNVHFVLNTDSTGS